MKSIYSYGDIEVRKKREISRWNKINITLSILFLILLILYLDESKSLKFPAMLFLSIFIIVHFIGVYFNLYERTNEGFLENWKNIDIYTHFLGSFVLYIILSIMFEIPLFFVFFLMLILGIAWEFLEYFLSILESKKNIIQDLIIDSIGSSVGLLFVVFFS